MGWGGGGFRVVVGGNIVGCGGAGRHKGSFGALWDWGGLGTLWRSWGVVGWRKTGLSLEGGLLVYLGWTEGVGWGLGGLGRGPDVLWDGRGWGRLGLQVFGGGGAPRMSVPPPTGADPPGEPHALPHPCGAAAAAAAVPELSPWPQPSQPTCTPPRRPPCHCRTPP